MIRFFAKFTLAYILFTATSLITIGQTTVWNNQNYVIKKDSAALIKLEDSTRIEINGATNASSLLNFPHDFRFQSGLDTFRNFSVSAYGYLQLGGLIQTNQAQEGAFVIAPFYGFYGEFQECHSSIKGSAPNRQFIVQWYIDGDGWGDMIRVQAILEEETGKVEFRYKTQTTTTRFSSRKVFCSATIKGYTNVAGVHNETHPNAPDVFYTDKTATRENSVFTGGIRFSFQPDLTPVDVAAAAPTDNLFPATYSIHWNATNKKQRIFWLTRATASESTEQISIQLKGDTSNATQSFTFQESGRQPDTTYTYYVYASNGFRVSQPVKIQVKTPMPMINGIVKIPGDYPAIGAMIEDAQIKHLGPDVIVELQPDYSYSSETKAVYFNSFLQNRLLKSVTIRPAGNADIQLVNTSFDGPVLLIDSIKNVTIDGRQNGNSTTIGLHFKQTRNRYPALAFIRHADNGSIQNCSIEASGTDRNNRKGLIYGGPSLFEHDSLNVDGINEFKLLNNIIGAETVLSERGIVLENGGKGHNHKIRNNIIRGFKTEFIKFHRAGERFEVVNNRLYQPRFDIDPVSNGAVISITSRGDHLRIDSNTIGGNALDIRSGYWASRDRSRLAIISVTNNWTEKAKSSSVSFNTIEQFSGNGFEPLKIYGGEYLIQHNRIGNPLNKNSIQQDLSYLLVMDVEGLRKAVIQKNIIAGIQLLQEGGSLYLLNTNGIDSLIIRENLIGNSEDPSFNTSENDAIGINISDCKNALCSNNIIQGISSSKGSLAGINFDPQYHYEETQLTCSNNTIKNLSGKLGSIGIRSHGVPKKGVSITNNIIHSLTTVGTSTNYSPGIEPYNTGIFILGGDFGSSPELYHAEIAYNKIHSLNHLIDPIPNEFPMANRQIMSGIIVEQGSATIHNNLIHLGYDKNGALIDSTEAEVTGIKLVAMRSMNVHFNSVYLGGGPAKIYRTNLYIPEVSRDDYLQISVSNNIFQNDTKMELNRVTDPTFLDIAINPYNPLKNVHTHNNIWYSKWDQLIQEKLTAIREKGIPETNTIIADPLFVQTVGNSDQIDLHLKPGSRADRSGAAGTYMPLYDLDSNLRKDYSPVDIGAYASGYCKDTVSTVTLTKQAGKPYFCLGDTVLLKASIVAESKYSIEWKKDQVIIPGATDSSLKAVEPGSYQFVIKTACGEYASDPIEIVVQKTAISLNLISEIGMKDFCETTVLPLKLNISGLTDNYQVKWYRNSIEQTGRNRLTETFERLLPQEQFRVELLPENSCIKMIADSLTLLNIVAKQNPDIRITELDSLICSYDSSSISYSVQQFQQALELGYQLEIPGSATVTHKKMDSSLLVTDFEQVVRLRLFTIATTDPNACLGTDTTEWISIRKMAPVAPPRVQRVEDILVSSSSFGNQWFVLEPNNIHGLLTGDSSQEFKPTANGNYYTRVTESGCISEPSNILSFEFNVSNQRIFHYPNPAVQFLWLKPLVAGGTSSLSWYNSSGSLVKWQQLVLEKNVAVKVTIPAQLKGLCYLKVKEQDGTETVLKVIVQN